MPAGPRALAPVAPGVALWWCALGRTPDEIADLATWLAPAETARAARFGSDALRHRWIAGRAALRLLLGDALGVPPAAVAIHRGARGRPQLADAGQGIDFNVSHTQDVALIAIARNIAAGLRIGVDVERADRDVGADRLARKFLTAREQATLAGRAPDERRRLFLRYWTCKEAMSKATGDGLIAPFRHLEVELLDGLRLGAGPTPYLPRCWSLHPVDVPAGWFATLAIWRGP
jgi:4'-phosphopantetheinyl transferase